MAETPNTQDSTITTENNTITINGQTYAADQLNEEARTQLLNLQIVDQEIKRLNIQLSIAQTARNAYGNALLAVLPTVE